MIGDYEKREHLGYLSNALMATGESATRNRLIFDWCDNNAGGLGVDVDSKAIMSLGGVKSSKWRLVRDAVVRSVEKEARNVAGCVTPSRQARNIAAVARFFELDEIEARILTLGAYCGNKSEIGDLTECLDDGGPKGMAVAVAALIGADPDAVATRLAPEGRLVGSGLVFPQRRHRRCDGRAYLSMSLRLLYSLSDGQVDDPDSLLTTVVGSPAKPELEWDDFNHMGEPRQFLADILAGALSTRAAGVNILLYGPPGTGKTEFCKVLAARVGAALYQVGESDEDGDEPSRLERIVQLRLAQKMLSRRDGALLLFDEMEDLLEAHDDKPSKVFRNRLIENNPLPTLWTCNNIESFDPAMLRRMTMAVELRTPPASGRERIWRRNLDRWQVTVGDVELRALATDTESAPALASNAARATMLANGGTEQLRLAATSIAKAMRGGVEPPPTERGAGVFNDALVQADVDLRFLTGRLCRDEAPRNFSLCLSGPPGTGKSAYVRHLADQLGMEVLHKRASDLLDKWVGESEKNIAAAFTEARDRRAFLIFDEADSLLQDRSMAQRSWEVTQVNEMLTWMERHAFPFACTTNLMDRLDPASLRRFTVKAKFGYLRPDQVAAAFVQFFGLEAPPDLRELLALTPGDFAVVERKARIFGDLGNPSVLVQMLRSECEAKPYVPRAIGFR